jgi:hypothetical protein
VQQSVNLVFAQETSSAPTQECNSISEEMQCSICKVTFSSHEELSLHQKSPAMPDIQSGAMDKISVKERVSAEKVANTKEQYDKQIQPIDINNATKLVETTVTKEFDSKRIKWLCRQPSFLLSKYIKSKRQCEAAIKQGRVFINHQVALDTGRIVRENDTVALVEECKPSKKDYSTAHGDSLASGVKIIETMSSLESEIPTLVVAYKPVGVRSAGLFSSDTLEMIVQRYFECQPNYPNLHCRSLSKVDTGCAGLCLLRVDNGMHGNLSPTKIIYHFTALVHGVPDGSWGPGVYVNVSNSGNRNWKRQKTLSDDCKAGEVTTTQNKLELNQALFIQCQDTYQIQNVGDTTTSISTLTIMSSYDDGRLANLISYTLRKLGFPVVNDRFAKREYSALPRRMKNLVKQKVCMGCYRLDINDATIQNHSVSIDPHKRTQCRFWREQLEPGEAV